MLQPNGQFTVLKSTDYRRYTWQPIYLHENRMQIISCWIFKKAHTHEKKYEYTNLNTTTNNNKKLTLEIDTVVATTFAWNSKEIIPKKFFHLHEHIHDWVKTMKMKLLSKCVSILIKIRFS